ALPISQQAAGKRDQSLLPPRRHLDVDDGVVTVGHLGGIDDDRMDVGELASLVDLVVGGVLPCKTDVFGDRVLQEEWKLRELGHLIPQACHRYRGDVAAVEQNAT